MTSQSWDRAKNLARITGKEPKTIRSYLSTLPKDIQEAIAGAKRRDNPILQPHITALETYTPPERQPNPRKTTRRSIGNPTLAPRAGAPTLNGTINIDTLISLKQYANKNGGLDTLQHHLDALRTIQNA